MMNLVLNLFDERMIRKGKASESRREYESYFYIKQTGKVATDQLEHLIWSDVTESQGYWQ